MKQIAGLILVALVASACGSSDASPGGVASLEGLETEPALEAADAAPGGAPDTTTTTLSAEDAMLAFTQCLREHGIDVDDPTPDDEGNLRLSRPQGLEREDREVFVQAREACAGLLEGVTFGFQERDRTEIEDALYEYAACMRDNGFDMPDPDFSGSGAGPAGAGPGGGGLFGSLDPEDPAFQAADETCRTVFGTDGFGAGGFGPGRGGGPRPGGSRPAGGEGS